MKSSILDFTLLELATRLEEFRLPAYTAKQLMEWVYTKRISDFGEITNISKKNIEKISEHFTLGLAQPTLKVTSKDKSEKYVFATSVGNVESVYLPEQRRNTLCISSQAGCKMNCSFCLTGKGGFSGNLKTSEIINQILSVDRSQTLTNIVFMGMGEPLDNIDNVLRVCEILTAKWGFAWSPKRITVSSCGLINPMKLFLEKSLCHLAISLHSPLAQERAQIMPIEKSNSIDKVIEQIRLHDFSHQRRISFEYIVFEGLNDSQQHIDAIAKLLKNIPCRVNLIKFHSIGNQEFKSPKQDKMEWFRDSLNKRGVLATIRRSRGEDISAACGQLKLTQPTTA